jgi:SPP1 gp7 family putative phage head morphogenesis protein
MARERFRKARLAQAAFERNLNGVARQINLLIRGITPTGKMTQADLRKLRELLRQYSHTLEPWAVSITERMQSEVSQRDATAWGQLGESLGRELRKEIDHAPTGRELRSLMAEQVKLITTMPIEAANRVQEYAFKLLTSSGRAEELQREILRTGAVTLGVAQRIARTQVATTASTLTRVRAEHLGSEGYFWRTARDKQVRPSHRKLEGKFIKWGDPPVVDDKGRRAHAGTDYNDRCYPEPVLPDVL